MNKLLLAAMVSSLAMTASANEDTPFDADLEFGFILTSGNTDSSTLTGKANIKQELTHWRNQALIEGLYQKDQVDVTVDDVTTSESQTSAQKFFVSAQTDRKLDDKYRGLFLYASYEDDRFSGYSYQSSIAVGFSDRLFNTSKSYLDYSVGPGIAIAETEQSLDDDGEIVASEKSDTLVLRVSGEYVYNISDHAKFTQTISSDMSGDDEKNTKSKAETAVKVNINSSLALKASYTINNNSVVADGIENTDTQTALTIVYSF